MTAAAPPSHPDRQDRIWAHAQNEEPGGFAAAVPRLEFLLNRVAALSARRPAGPGPPAVLNVGLGDGYFERAAAARGWVSHSLDPDPAASARLAADGTVTAHVGRLEELTAGGVDGLAPGTFEFVVASEVLEHLTEPQRTAGVAGVAGLLKPGGWFLGTVPDREDLALRRAVCPACGLVFHQYGHRASFDAAAVRTLLAPHFGAVAVGRSAFPAYRGRGPLGLAKSLAREALAKLGQPLAVPRLHWSARKPAA